MSHAGSNIPVDIFSHYTDSKCISISENVYNIDRGPNLSVSIDDDYQLPTFLFFFPRIHNAHFNRHQRYKMGVVTFFFETSNSLTLYMEQKVPCDESFLFKEKK